jgi:hypothetical protein
MINTFLKFQIFETFVLLPMSLTNWQLGIKDECVGECAVGFGGKKNQQICLISTEPLKT